MVANSTAITSAINVMAPLCTNFVARLAACEDNKAADKENPIAQMITITTPDMTDATKPLKNFAPEEFTPPSKEFAIPIGIHAALQPISIIRENAATSIPMITI